MLPNQVSSSMTVFCSNSLASSLCIVQNFPCAQFLSCKNRYGITYYTLKSTKSTNHPTNQPATLLTLFWFEQYHIHDTHYYYIQTTRTLVQDNLDVETTTPESPLSKKISRIVVLVSLALVTIIGEKTIRKEDPWLLCFVKTSFELCPIFSSP